MGGKLQFFFRETMGQVFLELGVRFFTGDGIYCWIEGRHEMGSFRMFKQYHYSEIIMTLDRQ